VTSFEADSVVPEDHFDFHSASQNLGLLADPDPLANIQTIFDKDHSTEDYIKEIAIVREYADQITNQQQRQETIDRLEELSTTLQERLTARTRNIQTISQEAKDRDDANQGLPLLRDPVANQVTVDDSNTDQEYLEMKAYHAQWKSLAQEHNVDTSQAHLRSAEEHNDLVTTFLVQSFMQVDSDKSSGVDPDAAELTGKCLQGALTAIAPKFCWKPGYHNHEIPYLCPAGWHRHMAECFKNCNPGYYFVDGGTCWANCRSGEELMTQTGQDTPAGRNLLGRRSGPYADHGATCFRSITDFYWKDSYWADRMTNFHGSVPCRADQYKSGAMCYYSCSTTDGQGGYFDDEKTPMENCGYDACASSGDTCTSTILNMVMEIGFTIASISALVLSGGTAAPAVVAGTQLVKQVGKGAAKTFAKSIAKSMAKQSAEKYGTNAVKATVKKFGKNVWEEMTLKNALKGWGQTAVMNYCKEYAKAFHSIGGRTDTQFDPASFDPTGTANAVIECKKPSEVGCASAIMGAIGTFDPTGLLGLASAFMSDKC